MGGAFKVSIVLLLFLAQTKCFEDNAGVFSKIKSGFKLAGKLLGLDQASGVAELVSEAFGKATRKGDGDGTKNVFSGFWRILGFDTKKIGAMAVNAIIFVAQLISTSLSKPPPSRLERARTLGKEESPFDWIMKNEKLTHLIKFGKDASLPHHINEYIRERSLDEDSGCIQLLICKSAPFVWAMQRALNTKEEEKKKGRAALFQFMPTLDEVADNGDDCEVKHPYCLIHY